MAEKVLSGFAIAAAVAGTVGLICLSIFDTVHYPKMHDAFLAVFIVGYIVSAIFLCAEYQRLGKNYRQHAVLRASFWVKLSFILLEIALAIVFGVSNRLARNVAAGTEWVIALIFTFWVLSFIIDLWPAVRRNRWGQPKTYGNQGAGIEFGSGQGLHAEDGQNVAYGDPSVDSEMAPTGRTSRTGRITPMSRHDAPRALEPSRNF